jgi:hypothetical protein
MSSDRCSGGDEHDGCGGHPGRHPVASAEPAHPALQAAFSPDDLMGQCRGQPGEPIGGDAWRGRGAGGEQGPEVVVADVNGLHAPVLSAHGRSVTAVVRRGPALDETAPGWVTEL